jgi:hypothetical protein
MHNFELVYMQLIRQIDQTIWGSADQLWLSLKLMVQAPEPLIERMEALTPNTVLEIPIVNVADAGSDDLGYLFPFSNDTVLVVPSRGNRDLSSFAEYICQVLPPAGTND